MSAEALIWHDGILRRVAIAIGSNAQCELVVALPKAFLSVERQEYRFAVKNAVRIYSNLDLVSLLDNARSGNIVDARIHDGTPSRLIVTLNEGHIEIHGEKVEWSITG